MPRFNSIYVWNKAEIGGNIEVKGAMSVTGSVTHSGDLSIGGNLAVTGDSTLGNVSMIGKCLRLGSSTYLKDVGGTLMMGTAEGASDLKIALAEISLNKELASTNTIYDQLLIQRYTSGTAQAGIGTAIKFMSENAAGTQKDLGSIEYSFTNVGAGTEASKLDFKVMNGGSVTSVMNFDAGKCNITAPVDITGNVAITGNLAITGTFETTTVTNTNVLDKTITLNDGGAASSGNLVGLYVEEGGSNTAYILTSNDRNSWNIKAPNNGAVVTITPTANTIITCNGDLNIAAASAINQDLRTTAKPTFDGLTITNNLSVGNFVTSDLTMADTKAVSGILKTKLEMFNGTVNTDNEILFTCDALGNWAASGGHFTVAASATRRVGTGSLLFSCDGAASAGDYCADAITHTNENWTNVDRIGFWVYSTTGIAAGDVNLRIYDGGGGGTTNVADIGSVAANTWTYKSINISAFVKSDVDSIGFAVTAAGAAKTFDMYIDQIIKYDVTNTTSLEETPVFGGIQGCYYFGDQAANDHTVSPAVENLNFVIDYNAAIFVPLTDLSGQIVFLQYCYW